ncbi:MAG: hypothetical protein V1866_03695 [archaeon]
MATFLDIGILAHFGKIFVVLIVFLITFGLLETIKVFPGKKGLNGLIALIIGLMFLVSNVATNMVKTMVPWFMVGILFIFFVLFMIRMWGLGDADIKKLVGDSQVYPWLVIIAVVILLGTLSTVFGQSLLEKGEGSSNSMVVDANGTYISVNSGLPGPGEPGSTTTSNFSTNMLNTLRHPKVLGMILVLIIGAFLMIFLTKVSNP